MTEWTDSAELETADVVVIGGGAAGLNGALMLARSRRSVLVIDAGAPRNAPADGVHGLLAREGMPPAELVARGRAEVRQYGGRVVDGTVASAVRDGDAFTVTLADGRAVRARRLLVTTGLVDELPDVPGLAGRLAAVARVPALGERHVPPQAHAQPDGGALQDADRLRQHALGQLGRLLLG